MLVRQPKLGDNKHLRVEITRTALWSYQESRGAPRGGDVDLTLDEAEEELSDVLRKAYITQALDGMTTVRARVSRLGVDVQAKLDFVTPLHARVVSATARTYDKSKSQARRAGTRRVRILELGLDGRVRVGVRGLEYRPILPGTGGAPPPWQPLHVAPGALAEHDAGLGAWLAKQRS